MKHKFNVDVDGDGAMLSLAIKLEPAEAGKVMTHKAQGETTTPEGLKEIYKEYGIHVLLSFLRSYVDGCDSDEPMPRIQKRKRRRKKK